MTFKKLLASTAAVAMLSGAAHAATATGAATVCYPDTQDFTTALEGDFDVTFTAAGTEFVDGTEYRITISVSGATIEDLAIADITETMGSGNISTPIITGGASGSTSVSFTFEVIDGDSAAGETIVVALPLEISAAGNVTVTADMESLNGATIAPVATLSVGEAVTGVTAVFDDAGGAATAKIDPANPDEFVGGGPTTDIGSLDLTLPTYDADCDADTAGAVAAVIGGGAGVDFTGTALAVGQFSAADVTVTSAATQTATLTTGFTGGTAAALGSAFAFTPLTGNDDMQITTAEDADLVASQLSATGTVTHASLTDLAVGPTDIAILQFDGTAADDITGAAFEARWLAMASTTADSVIRCTADLGFSAGVSVDVTLNNATDITDGTFTLASSPTEDATEFVFTAADIASASGSSGRADVTDINFVGESNQMVCDRLFVNRSNSTITAFGNKGN